MAPPLFEGPGEFPAGLLVYQTLWDLSQENDPKVIKPGTYDIWTFGRHQPEHHGYGDGYYCSVATPNGKVVGYQWAANLWAFTEAAEGDDVHALIVGDGDASLNLEREPPPAFEIGTSIKLTRELAVWGTLAALQHEGDGDVALSPGVVDVLDIVGVFDCQNVDITPPIEADCFYAYRLQVPHGPIVWAVEPHIKAACKPKRQAAEKK